MNRRGGACVREDPGVDVGKIKMAARPIKFIICGVVVLSTLGALTIPSTNQSDLHTTFVNTDALIDEKARRKNLVFLCSAYMVKQVVKGSLAMSKYGLRLRPTRANLLEPAPGHRRIGLIVPLRT